MLGFLLLLLLTHLKDIKLQAEALDPTYIKAFPDTVITKMRFHFVGAHNPSSQIYGIGGAASPFRILHQAMFGISLLLGDSAVWLAPFLG